MDNTPSTHSVLEWTSQFRKWNLIAGLLAAVVLTFVGMTATAPSAHADDTDGGTGTGVTGGDGCIHGGWTLASDIDQMNWFDSGAGDTSCGNTAYGQRNNNITFGAPGDPATPWTAQPTSSQHRCGINGGGPNLNCGDIAATSATANDVWTRQNTPLYKAVADSGAGSCVRRSDVHGIWYLVDGDTTPTWTNMGVTVSGQRSVPQLKSAIDSGPNLINSGSRGDNAWWDVRIREWLGAANYDQKVARFGAAVVRTEAKQTLKDTIKDVAGAAPVIFCWFSTAEKGLLTCEQALGPSVVWNEWLHPAGVTRDSAYNDNCVLRCPTVQGQYPNALPHAGEWIPSPSGTRTPKPASTNQQDLNNYCYPPLTVQWHQGGYGTEIGLSWAQIQTHGSDQFASAQPYSYTTIVEDGNGAYNASTGMGNAPGQGQLTTRTSTKLSSFGQFWNTYCATPTGCGRTPDEEDGGLVYSQAFINAYNAAVAAVPNDTHATVDLTDVDQTDVAKGRIVNVYERTNYVSAEARRLTDRFYVRLVTLTRFFGWSGNELPGGGATFTDWAPDAAAHPTWNSEQVPAAWAGQYRPDFSTPKPDRQRWDRSMTLYATTTPKVTGFWQYAIAHCNSAEFSNLNPTGVADEPNETGVIDTGDTSQYYSASAVDRVREGAWRANAPAVDPTRAQWGSLANNESALPAFFDRLCYYPGAARTPTTNAVKTSPARPDYNVFRDGVPTMLDGQQGDGDSAYFVPDFKGEDRHSVRIDLDYYEAKASNRTTADRWDLTWQERVQTGTTQYYDATPAYYMGTRTESWTTGVGGTSPTNGTKCNHDNPLQSPNPQGWGYQTWIPAGGYFAQGCKYSTIAVTSTIPAQSASGGDPIYEWQNRSAAYGTNAEANNGKAYCDSQASAGVWRSCSLTHAPATWSTPTLIRNGITGCPMADTATTRYTECRAVMKETPIVTNYNVVKYRNTDPTQIIVTRDPGGTPGADLAQMLAVSATGTTELFSRDVADTATPADKNVFQSQFAASPSFKSSTVAVASGAYKRLQAEARWASDEAKPHVYSVAWYFTPDVVTTVPSTNVGFGRAGGAMTYRTAKLEVPVRGRVEAEHSTLATPADGKTLAQHQDDTWESTGTGKDDLLNVPLKYGARKDDLGKWVRKPERVSSHYYRIEYVRAVGE